MSQCIACIKQSHKRCTQTDTWVRHSHFLPTALKSKLPILKTGQALERVLSNSRKIPHKATMKAKLLNLL